MGAGDRLNDPAQPFPVAAPIDSTYYTVTVTDPGSGCSLSDSVLVGVGSPFQVGASPDTVFCGTAPLILTVDPGGAVLPSYHWTTTLGILQSNDQQTVTLHPNVGTAIVIVTVTTAGCSDSDTLQIVALQAPFTPIIGQNADTLLATIGYANYVWTLNGDTIPGANGTTYAMTQSGLYTVTVTDTNGCSATSAAHWASLLAIGGMVQDPLWVEVDPGIGSIIVRTFVPVQRLLLYDAIGRVVQVREGARANGDRIELPVHGAGLYVLLVQNDRGIGTERVVVGETRY